VYSILVYSFVLWNTIGLIYASYVMTRNGNYVFVEQQTNFFGALLRYTTIGYWVFVRIAMMENNTRGENTYFAKMLDATMHW
jgi:hypothetical protein